MTLESRTSSVRYVGNGAATEFAVPFKFWKADNLRVVVGDGRAEQDVASTCTIEVTATGGNVTFPEPPAEGQIIVITRAMPFVQEDDYLNGTRFNPEDIEDRFDMDCAERQQLLDGVDRALKVPLTSEDDGSALVAELFQAKADAEAAAEAAVETLGGAEAVIAARDEVFAAMEAAGSIAGATQVVATGSTAPRALSDRFADFVNVKDYGAKGDGVNNDTQAIKNAIAHASLGCLLFPQGTYCIDDTLIMTGNSNGAYWFFGQSTLKWIGADAPEDYTSHIADIPAVSADFSPAKYNAAAYNINTYGWAYYGKPMIYISPGADSANASRCIIEGGNFNGDGKASIAIKVHSFGALIHGVRIRRVKHCGIALCGVTPWSASSGGVMVSDCYVANPDANGLGNSARRLQNNLPNDIGLYVHDLDNKISNSIFNFFGDAIVLRSSGNQITNCHTTVTFPHDSDGYIVDDGGTRVGTYPECSNIVVDPDLGTSSSGTNFLNNNYYNAGKYLVKCITGYKLTTEITGGAYLLKASWQKIYGSSNTPAFIFGGSQPGTLHADGLSVFHPAYFHVYDYYPDHALSSSFMDTVMDFHHDTSMSMNGFDLIDAANLVSHKAEDPVQLCGASYPIATADSTKPYVLIGCILQFVPNAESGQGGEVVYEVSHPGYSAVKGHLYYNPTQGKWYARSVDTVYGTFSDVEVYISNTANTATINGRTYLYWKMYAGSANASIATRIFLSMRPVDRTARVYLYRMHNFEYGTYSAKPSSYTSMLAETT